MESIINNLFIGIVNRHRVDLNITPIDTALIVNEYIPILGYSIKRIERDMDPDDGYLVHTFMDEDRNVVFILHPRWTRFLM